MRFVSKRSFRFHACALVSTLLLSTGALAQPDPAADIDALIEASASNEATLASAEAQVNAGDLTGAATTLERRLIDEPDATVVRIRYAVLLCELDDRQAAQYELSKMSAEPIDDASKAKIQASCGALSPTATQ
jgi:thioredoxin-like negative regulator of GroEL